MKIFKRTIIICLILIMVTMQFVFAAEIKLNDIKFSWAKDNIEKLVKLGIINGYPDNTFKPQKAVSADEFIKMVLMAMNYKIEPQNSEYWAEKYIKVAEKEGIANKTFINDYRLGITREQVARIITNTVFKEESRPSSSYASYIKKAMMDYHLIGDDYKQDMIDCYALGIMQGDNKSKMNPKDSISRAEATTVICRLMFKDQRLPIEFQEAKQIVLNYGLSGKETKTVIAPIYNGKAVNEIIDIAYILNNTENLKSGTTLALNENQSILYDGYGTKEQANWVVETAKKEQKDITYEDLLKLGQYQEFSFMVDTINFSSNYKPYEFTLWKKYIYETLGYNTYYDYFIDYYKPTFRKVFEYLFENEVETAWNLFEKALKSKDTIPVIKELKINGRNFHITYDSSGLGFRISLKNK